MQRCAPLVTQRLRMRVGGEQALIFDQRRLDFGVFRQRRAIGDAEALGRLALGQQVIVDAVLAHDARRFLRDRAAQLFDTGCGSAHGLPGLRLPSEQGLIGSLGWSRLADWPRANGSDDSGK